MNIAIFTNNYLPNPYGVTQSIESFRKEFEKRGHSVFIFAPRFSGFIDDNENVFRYPSLDINIRFRYPLPIPYSRKISKILEKFHLDIIHSQHPNFLGTVAAKWAKRKNIPLIFTWHTLYDRYTNFVPFVPEKISAGYIIRKAVKFANLADAVIAPTDSIIPNLRSWGVSKEVIPIATGVDEDDFRNPDRLSVRTRYGISSEDTVLILVSRLTEEKNVEFALRSLRKNLTENDKLKLIIIGDGYLMPKLKKFSAENGISEKIIFTGVVDYKEMKNYYSDSDIFIYSSKSETQGMILTEAMYMELPIVALRATGTSSLVQEGINGILTDEVEKDFSSAVSKLTDNIEIRKKMGEESGKIARENFTSTVSSEKLLKLYEEEIEKKLYNNSITY